MQDSITYRLQFPQELRGCIHLPASKSLSARALTIAALAGGAELSNLSDCDDTCVLNQALRERNAIIDIKAAGTAMRFATAFFATQEDEEHVLTGTERMRGRPIRLLVDALRALGADISYEENEGFPPLRIKGRKLTGGIIEMEANVSSQYISALLMIAPLLKEGLTLRLRGDIASKPYIEMTLGLMRRFGAEVAWNGEHEIRVAPKPYQKGVAFDVEPDWSAASYWYEMVALSHDEEAQVLLHGLTPKSLQGDSCVAKWFEAFGVQTTYTKEGALLTKRTTEEAQQCWHQDFTNCPDLAQTFVVTSVLKGKTFEFCGLNSLRIKETDRITALQCELKKLGYSTQSFQRKDEEIMTFAPEEKKMESDSHSIVPIATYEDHRMAMAFAPAAILTGELCILHPEVVSKSYPSFWDDLRSVGVGIQEIASSID